MGMSGACWFCGVVVRFPLYVFGSVSKGCASSGKSKVPARGSECSQRLGRYLVCPGSRAKKSLAGVAFWCLFSMSVVDVRARCPFLKCSRDVPPRCPQMISVVQFFRKTAASGIKGDALDVSELVRAFLRDRTNQKWATRHNTTKPST